MRIRQFLFHLSAVFILQLFYKAINPSYTELQFWQVLIFSNILIGVVSVDRYLNMKK